MKIRELRRIEAGSKEFVAHSSNVKCLKIGTKSCRLLITGGEDYKVNIWAIGKPNSSLSLSGHTSAVECVTLDSAEVLAASGASTGAVKLWDLEEAKGKTNCTAIEFHPFGEFFASGSLDTNLKIWDIRRKGCIHTYKGHTRGISTIRFSPDGRWVVTGGEDSVVKVWDLTAGKLLHDFKFHGGRIRCIDFHPHEFLLATGSVDRTVKFWDLETFELIGSAGPEATGIRSVAFHPDGRTLFCGLDESLKVFSWEPIRCHDAVDMGWSTLGDLRIHEGRLLACSYQQASVGVWVADISLIGPYAAGMMPRSNGYLDSKYGLGQNQPERQVGSSINAHGDLLAPPCGYDSKDTIRRSLSQNSIESNHSTPRRIEPAHDSKESYPSSNAFNFRESNIPTPKKSPVKDLHAKAKAGGQAINRPIAMPVIVPRDSFKQGSPGNSRKDIPASESIESDLGHSGRSYTWKQSSIKNDMGRQLLASESSSISKKSTDRDNGMDQNFQFRFIANADTPESCDSTTNIRNTAEKFKGMTFLDPPLTPRDENDANLPDPSRVDSVKYVKGVAVELGRTRSLVERWEKRERCTDSETSPASVSSDAIPKVHTIPSVMNEQVATSEVATANDEDSADDIMQNHDSFLSVLQSRLAKLQVVRHFWERNDIKGAINAVARLPDHSVQADLVSILLERIEVVTLDLFCCLLPLLASLLDSKVER
ncbi:hypothetical protein ACLOJK_020536 [Asimina triloba]